MGKNNQLFKKYCYWFKKDKVEKTRDELQKNGIIIPFADRLPCKALKVDIAVVTPEIWKNCRHDAYPWYESSDKSGKYLITSNNPLPEKYKKYLDCVISETDFRPKSYPSQKEVKKLSSSAKFKSREPKEWFTIPPNFSAKMTQAFKIALGINKSVEEMRTVWSAVHSNFMEGKIALNKNGNIIPYTIADTSHTTTCCIELFNIIGSEFKTKLVKTSLGAKTMNALKDEKYYRVESMKGVK